jgi:hypothetical protein
MQTLPLKFDNKTAFAFTCKGSTGEGFIVSDKINKAAATIAANMTQASVLYAGRNGSVTWMDNAKGATLKLLFTTDAAGKKKYNIETSHHFKAIVSVAKDLAEGIDLVQIELSGSYDFQPPPGIRLPDSGPATGLCIMRINTAIEGKPADTVMKNAFELSMTIPDFFHPIPNGRDKYNEQQGYFSGERDVQAVLKWETGYEEDGNGDTIITIAVFITGLPEGIPVWVNMNPTNNSKWRPGPKFPAPPHKSGDYYKIVTTENEPGSPHVAVRTLGIIGFECRGMWWFDKLIPADIITPRNMREKMPVKPGIEEMKKDTMNTRPGTRVLPVEKTTINKPVIRNTPVKQ